MRLIVVPFVSLPAVYDLICAGSPFSSATIPIWWMALEPSGLVKVMLPFVEWKSRYSSPMLMFSVERVAEHTVHVSTPSTAAPKL